MSEASKAARKAMKAKISRITRTDPKAKVDASGYTPPDALDTDVKTGMRPISRRQFRRGGKVFANEGHATKPRADKGARIRATGFGSEGKAKIPDYHREKRATGGNVVEKLENRDVRELNRDRVGSKHIGGFKKGGKVKAGGGPVGKPTAKLPVYDADTDGGNRRGRYSGGPVDRGLVEKSMKAAQREGVDPMNSHDTQKKKYGEALGRRERYAAEKAARQGRAAGGTTNDAPEDSYGSPHNSETSNRTSTQTSGGHTPGYSKTAVDKAIASSNRSGRKISGREAAKIHAVLRGRYAKGGKTYGEERDDESSGENHGPKCGCPKCCDRAKRADGGRLGGTPGTTAYDTRKPTYWDAVKDRAKNALKNEDSAAPKFKNPIATGNPEQPYEGIGGKAREDAIMGMANGDPPPQKKRGGSINMSDLTGTNPRGMREARARGGRTKGKTNINIIIGAGKQPAAMPMPMPPPGAPPGPPGGPPGLHQGAPPPMMPPQGGPPPPMARRTGGRVSGKRTSYSGAPYGTSVAEGLGFDRHTEDGSKAPPFKYGGGGGLERLEAARRQGAKPKV